MLLRGGNRELLLPIPPPRLISPPRDGGPRGLRMSRLSRTSRISVRGRLAGGSPPIGGLGRLRSMSLWRSSRPISGGGPRLLEKGEREEGGPRIEDIDDGGPFILREPTTLQMQPHGLSYHDNSNYTSAFRGTAKYLPHHC